MSSNNSRAKLKLWKGSVGGTNPCRYCRVAMSFDEATLEHKHPKVRGGTEDPKNLALSCQPCNKDKGDMTDREYLFYTSPLGFIPRLFLTRKYEILKIRNDIIHTTKTREAINKKHLKNEIMMEIGKQLQQTQQERDRYRDHVHKLVSRILKMEQYHKLEYKDGEYKKITKKQQDKDNAQSTVDLYKKEIDLEARGLIVSKDR
jgi:hypothetical protein